MEIFLSRSRPSKSYIKHPSKPSQKDIHTLCRHLFRVNLCLNTIFKNPAKNEVWVVPEAISEISSCIDEAQELFDDRTLPRRPGWDEAAVWVILLRMEVIRKGIERREYVKANNMAVCLQEIIWNRPIDDPVSRVVDKEAIDAIVVKIHTAHAYAKKSMFPAAANLIIKILESPTINEDDFIDAAIQHHLASKRTWNQEVEYLERNVAIYREAVKLRPENILVQSVCNYCENADRELYTSWSGAVVPRSVTRRLRSEYDGQSCLDGDDEE